MSTTINTETEVAHAARWSEWQAANAKSSRRGAVRARIIFIALFAAVIASLVGILVSS
jgi:hypothetical protein